MAETVKQSPQTPDLKLDQPGTGETQNPIGAVASPASEPKVTPASRLASSKSTHQEEEESVPKNPGTNHIEMARNVGYALIFIVAGFASSQNDFSELWKVPHQQTPLAMAVFVARLVLFALLVILTLRWIIATNNELFIWLLWLDHPFQRNEVYGAFFALAIFLGIAVAFPHHVIVISALLTAGLLLNYWTQWLANEQFERALKSTQQETLGPKRTRALPILIAYWIERPQLGRIATMMFVSGVAYSCAFASAFAPTNARVWLELAADVILIINIAIGETVIAVWRSRRDTALRELLA